MSRLTGFRGCSSRRCGRSHVHGSTNQYVGWWWYSTTSFGKLQVCPPLNGTPLCRLVFRCNFLHSASNALCTLQMKFCLPYCSEEGFCGDATANSVDFEIGFSYSSTVRTVVLSRRLADDGIDAVHPCRPCASIDLGQGPGRLRAWEPVRRKG